MSDPETHKRAVKALNAAIAVAVETIEDATGERLLVKPSVMDGRFSDLVRMEAQAVAYIEAMAVVRRWALPSKNPRLGDLLKVIPADEAELITGHLQRAGLLR